MRSTFVPNRFLANLSIVILWVVSAVPVVAQQAVVDSEAPAKREVATAVKTRVRKATESYMRITKKDDGNPDSLETSIVRFEGVAGGPFAGKRVDLIGVVHIGEQEYYEILDERFKKYDKVLYELVAPEGTRVSSEQAGKVRGPLGAMQLGMRDMLNLEFQLQHIDYEAENFRHADMSAEEFSEDMESRGDSVMKMVFRMIGSGMATQAAADPAASDSALLLALFAPDRARRMKQIMARQFQDMEIVTASMTDDSGKSTIITERNGKVMEILKDELSTSDTVAIFYGAGHLPDMDKRLRQDFAMEPTASEWLQAWDLQKN